MKRTPEALIQSIKDKLDHFRIKLNNRKNDNDYYKLAEDLLIPVLDRVFDCHLRNLNKDSMNTAGIDLADASKRISFQVTRETSLTKVRETIEKTLQYHHDLFDSLYIVCLADKQQSYSQDSINKIINGTPLQFDVNRNIIDISDISARINSLASTPSDLTDIEGHLIYVLSGDDDPSLNGDGDINLAKKRVLEQFIQNKYIDSQYIKQHFDLQLSEKYSELFSYISSFEGAIDSKMIKGNLFDFTLKHILRTESENPLVLTGLAGSGKSTFLSLLYKFCSYKLSSPDFSEVPVYINLQTYLKDPSEEQALNNLQSDIAFINQQLAADKEVILILDGYDDSFRYVIDTSNKLISLILQQLGARKKVIGINISDNNFYIAKPETVLYNITNDADSRITLQNISIHDKNYTRFITLYVDLKLYHHKGASLHASLETYLKEKIRKYKILRVDFFTLFIFCEKQYNITFNNCRTLSDFYKQFCFEKLRNSTERNLLTVSDMAFDFYIKKREIDQPNPAGWELIHTHLTIRDYLLAFQVINRLKYIGSSDNRFSKKDYESFNFVYTDIINNFCKEIMNSDLQTEKYVHDGITKIFKKLELTAQTHFCYLLGRLSSQNQKDSADNFLKTLLQQVNNYKGQSPDNQYLLYCRTIYISLIYLGNPRGVTNAYISNAYIQRLLDDPQWDNINRGFHREYYGDIPFDPGLQSLTLEDNVQGDFSNTYTKLYRKLNDSLDQQEQYNLFEIELYTLCSLAQHRQADKNGRIELEQINAINELIDKIIDSGRPLNSESLRKYIVFLKGVFQHGRYVPPGLFLDQVYNIKEENRAGWLERGLQHTEKVSSHMYGAFLIGKLCLPDQLHDNSEYDKSRILNMILTHDLGEAIVGDKTPAHKTPEHKQKEKNAIEAIGMLGSYFGNKLFTIAKDYKDFESKNEENINIQIANELDKLDNLMQLYVYALKQKLPIPDYESWRRKQIDSIKSEPGRKIRDMIIEYYEHYL